MITMMSAFERTFIERIPFKFSRVRSIHFLAYSTQSGRTLQSGNPPEQAQIRSTRAQAKKRTCCSSFKKVNFKGNCLD